MLSNYSKSHAQGHAPGCYQQKWTSIKTSDHHPKTSLFGRLDGITETAWTQAERVKIRYHFVTTFRAFTGIFWHKSGLFPLTNDTDESAVFRPDFLA